MDQKKALLPSIMALDKKNRLLYILGIVCTITIVFATVALLFLSFSMPKQQIQSEVVVITR